MAVPGLLLLQVERVAVVPEGAVGGAGVPHPLPVRDQVAARHLVRLRKKNLDLIQNAFEAAANSVAYLSLFKVYTCGDFNLL